ncbi:ATP phosphoribosyltransferase [Liquorilactobacillus vini DSM 20605]|uniref:ATP phosphoribosyltransferase n=3 Tax=Liquorilactobacillus vini TaxID=238015 RepID=A0A0R2C9S9_9LACO|nr:ATP phosphoribosyltransferase [Liquorilactobacillus vini DSM 20605]
MPLKIALTKGRVEKQVIPLLEAAGIDCSGLKQKNRKLIINTSDDRFQFILAKGPDVTTYLNSGAVDLGIVGSDILTEHRNQQSELLDLRVGQCQFVLASTSDFNFNQPGRKVIGTKYPLITQLYFESLGQDVEIIKIEGSVELAPLIGLADAIVDITETGRTLRENNLYVYDYLDQVSTRLVANRMSLKQHAGEIFELADQLEQVVEQGSASK